MNLDISMRILKCTGNTNSLVVLSNSECLNPMEALLSDSIWGDVSLPEPRPRFFYSFEMTLSVYSEMTGFWTLRRVSFLTICLVFEAVTLGANLGVPDVS